MDTNVTKIADARRTDKSEPGQIVLVLQGGGALGSYQAGVYQALHEDGIEPDWIIGTSIGAINASLIAGNPPENAWSGCRSSGRGWNRTRSEFSRRLPGSNEKLAYWTTRDPRHSRLLRAQSAGAFRHAIRSGPNRAGFYSTAPLEQTLLELVDFDLVNDASRGSPSAQRMSAPARCSISTAAMARLGVKHIMASGALPPAFPAVRIDGELYWDGGILSNTPTEAVFDDNPRKNSLIFAVHLWNPSGDEPNTIWEVLNRQKDMQYSSRIASHIARQQQTHRLRHVINHSPRGCRKPCATRGGARA